MFRRYRIKGDPDPKLNNQTEREVEEECSGDVYVNDKYNSSTKYSEYDSVVRVGIRAYRNKLWRGR